MCDLGSGEENCFLWNENAAKRGACEVAPCSYAFIDQKSKLGVKDFVFYSDNCHAQNKNRYYITMLWFCLHKYKLHSITHKYLEKGHTFNENDSIHATVEHASKKIHIYNCSMCCNHSNCKEDRSL